MVEALFQVNACDPHQDEEKEPMVPRLRRCGFCLLQVMLHILQQMSCRMSSSSDSPRPSVPPSVSSSSP